jgi:glycosyltransferase involved in cell wall biosynthesis
MKYYGGAELLIVELANWMTKMGIKNDILTLSKSKKVEDLLIDTDIIIPSNNIDLRPPGYKNIKDIFKAIRVFRKKLIEIKDNYNIINFHDFPVTWSLWPRKKSAVWFMNQPPNLWSKPNAGWFYKLLNKIRIWSDRFIVRHGINEICVLDNSFHKQAYKRYGINSNIVYCGVNHDFFSYGNREKAIREYNLKGKFIIMYSGQIAEGKNTLDCVKAIEKIKDKIPNILLILIGKEDLKYKTEMDSYIKERKLEKYVKFIGMINKKEKLQDLYKAANVGLFPVGKQGGWIAPFEMVSSGIPTVMSSDMGSSTIAKEHNLCIVTKEYDKAILEIYNNYNKYKENTKKAAIYIKDNFSWKQYAERMIYIFRKTWKIP